VSHVKGARDFWKWRGVPVLPFVIGLLITGSSNARRIMADASPPAKYAAAELRAQLRDVSASLTSIDVRYRADGYGPGFPKGTYLYRAVAAAAPYYLDHLSAHGHDILNPADDFLQQHTYVTRDRWLTEHPLSRTFFSGSLKPTDPLPGTMGWEGFFLDTGLWPMHARQAPRPNDIRWTFDDVAESREHSYVRPLQENIRGSWCHVLEWPGRDRMWLDVGHSCCIVAREILDPTSHVVTHRLDLGGHSQYAAKVWLPGWIRTTTYSSTASEPSGQLTESNLTVLYASVNTLSEARFQFEPLPGELSMQPGKQPEQVRPGGIDHLEMLADKVRKNIASGHNDATLPSLGSILWILALPIIVWLEIRRSTWLSIGAATTIPRQCSSLLGRLNRSPTPLVRVPETEQVFLATNPVRSRRRWYLIASLSALLASFAMLTVYTHSWSQPTQNVTYQPFFDGLGSYSRRVSTDSPMAQRYFNQGLAFLYGFEREEANRSFQAAAAIDPSCPMAYWGIAMANGPNINDMAISIEQAETAWRAVNNARNSSLNASQVERALIEAISSRYSPPTVGSRRLLDEAYANSMQEVARNYPEDPDVAALAAESLLDLRPWDQWKLDGTPQPGTLQAVRLLESALAKAPSHPFALHLLIHAVEASPHPEKADEAARRLRDIAPGIQHLIHMASHIDVRLGRWQKAVTTNEKAIEAETARLASSEGPLHRSSFGHNYHMLAFAAMMSGQSAIATKASREFVSTEQKDLGNRRPAQFDGLFAMPYEVSLRFGRWDGMLGEPVPPEAFPITTALWHYARAIAFAAKHQLQQARNEQQAFEAARMLVPTNATVLNCPAVDLLNVAGGMLAGEIFYRNGNTDKALAALRQAIDREDNMPYAEPPTWLVPVRHALGATLMDASRYSEAEAVYREDLLRHPENGWSLYGLARSLSLQGRKLEATAVMARFKEAWKDADFKICSSCCCLPTKDEAP
jgi:tetratricopeptide (TPR) repeat protein